MANHSLVDASIVGAGGHVRCRLKAGMAPFSRHCLPRCHRAAWRGAAGRHRQARACGGNAVGDRWGGTARAQMRIIDAAARRQSFSATGVRSLQAKSVARPALRLPGGETDTIRLTCSLPRKAGGEIRVLRLAV